MVLRQFSGLPEFRMAVISKIVRRDWTELNLELLRLIAKKLGNLSNFIRFRSVCKQWRAAADPVDLPPQLPWILFPATLSEPGSYPKNDYIIYSLSSQSTSKIELPVTYGKYRYHTAKDPSTGFIFSDVIDRSRIEPPYLYNPLTENKIHLPFTKYAKYYLVYMGPSNKSNSSKVKSGVHLIVYAHWMGQTEIGSWRSDTNEFITFTIPFLTAVVGYYKGKVFVYQYDKTSVFDMTTGAKMNVVIPHPAEFLGFNFFVEAMGDLLAVKSYRGEGGSDDHQIKVYRLEHTDDFGQCRWIKLNGIGERVLFLGRRPGGLCLSASDFEGLRGNCIYLIQPPYEDGFLRYSRLLRYDMEKGISHELLNCVAGPVAWFFPRLSYL